MHKIPIKDLSEFMRIEFKIELNTPPHLTDVLITELDKNTKDTINWTNRPDIDWGKIDSAILISPKNTETPPNCKTQVLKVERPREVFTKILRNFFEDITVKGISPNASIGNNCGIDADVHIGHNCVVGDNVSIGSGTTLDHGVIIHANTKIGRGCMLNSGCIIGGHGFGYEKIGHQYERIPHLGNVIIEDRVEVGALTCINRGTLGSTRIKSGVKIDDSSFVAHNVVVGLNTIICSHVVICGSVTIGDNSWIAPGVMVRDGLEIGERAVLGMGSIVTKSVESGTTVFGNPARKKLPKQTDGKI